MRTRMQPSKFPGDQRQRRHVLSQPQNPTSGKGTQAQQEKEKFQLQARVLTVLQYTEGPRPGYDDYGQELRKDARLWKAYVQESKVWDDMIRGRPDSVRVGLVGKP
ncbi:hypothetical protein FRC10_005095, partial [Ceratobasidium sp. 414]